MGRETVKYGAFNEDFFVNSGLDITWFDRKGVIQVKEGINAEIIISTKIGSGNMSTVDHYRSYVVRILNKEGVITSNTFDFNTYFENRSSRDKFEIIEYCCDNGVPSWSGGCRPTLQDISKMVKAIVAFISQYKNL